MWLRILSSILDLLRRERSDTGKRTQEGERKGVSPQCGKEPVKAEGTEPVRPSWNGAGSHPFGYRGGWGQRPQNPLYQNSSRGTSRGPLGAGGSGVPEARGTGRCGQPGGGGRESRARED